MRNLRRRVLPIAFLFAAGAGLVQAASDVQVVQIPLSMSNVHLIKGAARSFLVDTGSKDDLPALAAALAREGVRFRDLAAVILTHGHADHAALAAEIRRRSGAVPLCTAHHAASASSGSASSSVKPRPRSTARRMAPSTDRRRSPSSRTALEGS